ncbi:MULTISPECIES: hypothetical protein [unclassified Mesorhizobium]|uniref:hypothetical protein n=1 Tax=unclassified Mesorhizobium TaxID=325217 RepID=UPI0016786332|nr:MULTISPECIES: hypothetical protein [unclassified Mesorhizobium]
MSDIQWDYSTNRQTAAADPADPIGLRSREETFGALIAILTLMVAVVVVALWWRFNRP